MDSLYSLVEMRFNFFLCLVSDEWSLGFDGDSLWTARLWVFE